MNTKTAARFAVGILIVGIGFGVLFDRLVLGVPPLTKPAAAPPPGVKTPSPPPLPRRTVSPDPSFEGKFISLRDLGRKSRQIEGIRVVTKGRIVFLGGSSGEYLRDEQGNVVKLDFDSYQGKLREAKYTVRVTGKVKLRPNDPRNSLVFVVSDVKRD